MVSAAGADACRETTPLERSGTDAMPRRSRTSSVEQGKTSCSHNVRSERRKSMQDPPASTRPGSAHALNGNDPIYHQQQHHHLDQD
eukprot:1420089-Rhodomonas_salina.3